MREREEHWNPDIEERVAAQPQEIERQEMVLDFTTDESIRFSEYDGGTGATVAYPDVWIIIGDIDSKPIHAPWLYPLLGLGEEAGELFGKMKKMIRDENGVMSEERLKGSKAEIGDVLWYCARLALAYGTRLGTIARDNLRKTIDRRRRNVLHGSGDNR